ncbi:MAG TPA: sulfotransferase [Flavobacteriaceae bacterium]|nr:sulfotransferase [Flavobacteriaceae bacterium]
MSTKKCILVTGSNRSGSTWVGKVIGEHPKVDYIIEPLNLNRIERFGKFNIDKWYLKINEESDENLKREVRALLNYYLNLNVPTFLKTPFEKYEGHSMYMSLKKRIRRAHKPIKLLKDPTALFLVPWMVREFGVSPVVLIRHPAAYVLSIKEKKWWFDFNHILRQEHFFDELSSDLKDEVVKFKTEESNMDIIDNAALLWKVFYAQVLEYKGKYPDWLYITHETLSLHSMEAFRTIFDYLEIELTLSVQKYITLSTKAINSEKHLRDAAENAVKWKKILTKEEQQRVYGITHSVSNHFYDSF